MKNEREKSCDKCDKSCDNYDSCDKSCEKLYVRLVGLANLN